MKFTTTQPLDRQRPTGRTSAIVALHLHPSAVFGLSPSINVCVGQ